MKRNSSKTNKSGSHSEEPHNFIKNKLVSRLNLEIKKLNFMKGVDSLEKDQIFGELSEIEQQAKEYGFVELQKLAQLAMGKRILNFEIERKRLEIESKKQKKKVIEDFFRENRIKEVDYHDLALKKIREKCFIVMPYPSGRAFIESDNIYTEFLSKVNKASYRQALSECEYLPTIKAVNKIFFRNFSQGSNTSKYSVFDSYAMRLGLLLLVLQIIICVVLFWVDVENGESILLGNSGLLIAVFLGITVQNFFEETSTNYQLHETIQEIDKYF